jgi:hypothetical protein
MNEIDTTAHDAACAVALLGNQVREQTERRPRRGPKLVWHVALSDQASSASARRPSCTVQLRSCRLIATPKVRTSANWTCCGQ